MGMRKSLVVVILLSIRAVTGKEAATRASHWGRDRVGYVQRRRLPGGFARRGLSPDGEAFTVAFSQLFAAVGSGIASTDASHRCRLHVKLTVPPGWSYALASVDYRGYVSTIDFGDHREPSIDVSHLRRVAGEDDRVHVERRSRRQLRGPRSRAGAPAPAYWSRCGKGKNLTIDSRLDVQGENGQGLVTVDALDGEIFHLLWQQCS